MDLVVRRMDRREVGLAVDWAAAEGWNPGVDDADCFYRAFPEAFFLCESRGRTVGCISAAAYDEHFGFIGFFIVAPELRGGRVGVALGRAALSALGDRNIGLDGVEAKIRNYEAFGFKLAYNNIRFEGEARRPLAAPPGVVELSAVPFQTLSDYDRKFFPAPRPGFLSLWIGQRSGVSLGLLRDGRLAGYGVLRACRKGSKVGPLFADDGEAADALLRALLLRAAPGSLFYLDVPGVNPEAVALAGRYGMRPVFKTARMYSRQAPPLPVERIFGVTSFELG
ncbi:MAG: GNAT family N-acetyltransferase [Elusimicrobia bacterium]|jgi:GNAT superfamily N-acetyltransferase|nr:GNAT family N-acetyltransferase [Elusimicrobiota bacterium]